jgi:hypothetical protein
MSSESGHCYIGFCQSDVFCCCSLIYSKLWPKIVAAYDNQIYFHATEYPMYGNVEITCSKLLQSQHNSKLQESH